MKSNLILLSVQKELLLHKTIIYTFDMKTYDIAQIVRKTYKLLIRGFAQEGIPAEATQVREAKSR